MLYSYSSSPIWQLKWEVIWSYLFDLMRGINQVR